MVFAEWEVAVPPMHVDVLLDVMAGVPDACLGVPVPNRQAGLVEVDAEWGVGERIRVGYRTEPERDVACRPNTARSSALIQVAAAYQIYLSSRDRFLYCVRPAASTNNAAATYTVQAEKMTCSLVSCMLHNGHPASGSTLFPSMDATGRVPGEEGREEVKMQPAW